MKKIKQLFTALTVLCALTTTAQESTIKLQNAINEQFGTLLESLMKDGKIEESNARVYLETVFGYDPAVSNYLQTANLSQTITKTKRAGLSLDNYVTALSDNLVELIPESYRTKMLQDPYYQGVLIGNELKSGYVSQQSVEYMSNIFKSISDERQRNIAIRAKLEELTPKLNSLKSPDGSFIALNKKNLSFTVFNSANWSVNKLMEEKQSSNAYNALPNNVVLTDDKLVLSNKIPRMHDHALFMFYTMKTFKNKDRFDFSKDFQLDVYYDIPEKTRITGLGILIGKSYQLELLSRGGKKIDISTPSKYAITQQYGFLRSGDWPYNKIDEKIPKEKLLVDGHSKVTIVKKGSTFSCLVNGESINVNGNVIYFPDKYFLGFKQAGTDPVTILKVEMKHL